MTMSDHDRQDKHTSDALHMHERNVNVNVHLLVRLIGPVQRMCKAQNKARQ